MPFLNYFQNKHADNKVKSSQKSTYFLAFQQKPNFKNDFKFILLIKLRFIRKTSIS